MPHELHKKNEYDCHKNKQQLLLLIGRFRKIADDICTNL